VPNAYYYGSHEGVQGQKTRPSWLIYFGGVKPDMDDRKSFFDDHASSWDEHLKLQEQAVRLRDLAAAFELNPGDRVLDVGTGTGVLLPIIREAIGTHGQLLAMDFSFRMLEQAKERREGTRAGLINAGVAMIPFRAGEFDRVTCFAAFPHFPDKKRALSEMVRVLKRHGVLVIAHIKTAEEINQMHSHIGGAVAHDHVPEPQILKEGMAAAGLDRIVIANEPGRFVAKGWKS
jgi:ubiquinone/menaquinone biosynthesis C-methylase UbiE